MFPFPPRFVSRPATRLPAVVLAGSLAAALIGGCGRERARPGPARPLSLDVRVGADTSRAERLGIEAPARARVWVSRIARARDLGLPAPEVRSDTLSPEPPAPPALTVSRDLKPPILRSAAPLWVPAHSPRASVEIDVRVDESGVVTDALWAGGSRDSVLVAAATACALSMRFYAALQAGQPVAVWCRQRFDFAGR